jgi:hypothetical protein
MITIYGDFDQLSPKKNIQVHFESKWPMFCRLVGQNSFRCYQNPIFFKKILFDTFLTVIV